MTSRRSPSLTFRLTLLFALTAALVLFLLGLLIGNSVEQHFEEQDMEVLTGKMELVRHILGQSPEVLSSTSLKLQLDNALTGHHGLVVSIHALDGKPIYANEKNTLPAGLLKGPASGDSRPLKWTTSDGMPMRGIVSLIMAGGLGQPVTVGIATEMDIHEHFMSSFRQTLWSFIALATMAMGMLGWFVVRRGLSPLQAIKRQASEITANRLYTRLPADAIPLELADLAETLNDMLSRLEDSFLRLSDFSSDLAHELRTPVSNLLTQTQVTLSRARTADNYREILASNAEEFERLSRMIADMLFLAKADNQQIIPHQERIELADEVTDLLEYYEILADEKAIALSLSGRGEVSGDRLMLRRAISNLLSNAIRHTPNGGTITTRIARGTDGNSTLTVENTGSTISAEHLPRLFDRFYRADSSRHRTTENSGLGLAITRSIVLAHDGNISVQSADGITCFTLCLPNGSKTN